MNSLDYAPNPNVDPTLEMNLDMEGFDINAAFQESIVGVATDEELALNEKVLRMELIVEEATSDLYVDFVDFREMAAQMEMICNHNHSLNEALQDNETVSEFMNANRQDEDSSKTEYEIDPKTGKRIIRKKKKQTLLSFFSKT